MQDGAEKNGGENAEDGGSLAQKCGPADYFRNFLSSPC